MTRPENNPYDRSGRYASTPREKKLHIKKKWRPLSQRRTPGEVLEDWVHSILLWLKCMCDPECPAYRAVFPAALWGEMGEYNVRASTLAGIALLVGAYFDYAFLSTSIFLVKLKFVSIIGFVIIGIYQLRDLAGPIWWADRYAIEQVKRFFNNQEVEPYERFGEAMARLRPNHDLPITPAQARRLGELYRQFYYGELSERSWRELKNYTEAQVTFFYTLVGLTDADPRFPEEALKQPGDAQPQA